MQPLFAKRPMSVCSWTFFTCIGCLAANHPQSFSHHSCLLTLILKFFCVSWSWVLEDLFILVIATNLLRTEPEWKFRNFLTLFVHIANQVHRIILRKGRWLLCRDMYIELTGFDRHLSGFVTETQLSLVALRFDLPLKISTLKLAVRKFVGKCGA